jgi:starch synthase/alpha-amylase
MGKPSAQSKILFVTPEVIFIPDSPDHNACYITSGGPTYNLVYLIRYLLELGIDVHVAQPDYRRVFAALLEDKHNAAGSIIPGSRVHLAEDRLFFYSNHIDSNSDRVNTNIALAFQREVGNQILPRVQPDLIHCHDWMTGLIPAMAKHWDIPCLFTVKSLGSAKSSLSIIEDRGIDGAAFWQHLFYDRYPVNYEETRDTNPVDFLLSGILAAHYVSIASRGILSNIITDRSDFFYSPLGRILAQKWDAGYACEISNSTNPPFNPASSGTRYANCWPIDQKAGKQQSNRAKRRHPFLFDNRSATQRYIDLYETILQRPLVKSRLKKASTKKNDIHVKIPNGQAISYRKANSNQVNPIQRQRISNPAMAPI